MRYGELTYEEIHEHVAGGALAVVPTGCTEQQGPHLPVDFDTWFSEQICLAASEKAAADLGVDSLVLPAMPFGPTPEHRSYGAGYVDLPRDIHEATVLATLESLREQGFRRLVVWRGCGEHDLRNVLRRFNTRADGEAMAYLPAHPYHAIWCRISDPAVPGGHADSFSTSVAMYLRPESVRTDKIVDPKSSEVDWADVDLDFGRYSSTGVIGDPTHASAELGAKLWSSVVAETAAVLRSIADGEMDAGPVADDRLHFLDSREE